MKRMISTDTLYSTQCCTGGSDERGKYINAPGVDPGKSYIFFIYNDSTDETLSQLYLHNTLQEASTIQSICSDTNSNMKVLPLTGGRLYFSNPTATWAAKQYAIQITEIQL